MSTNYLGGNNNPWDGYFCRKDYFDEDGNRFPDGGGRYIVYYHGKVIGYEMDQTKADMLFIKTRNERERYGK